MSLKKEDIKEEVKKKTYQSPRQLLLNSLNNIKFTDQKLRDIKHFIETKKLPHFDPPYANSKREQFIKNFDNDNYKIKDDGTLIYKPLNKEILSTGEKENILGKMYNDDKIGIGIGVKPFYNKVADQYVGIGKIKVGNFLNDQSSYQITKPEPKVVNKPIITTYPNQRWNIDLIDVAMYASKNNNCKYILTVIDNFSKYVFAIGLKEKNAKSILDGMKKIIKDQAQNTYPRMIQSDNGGEFKNGLFEEWAEENKITLKLSMSYQPTSNALIENYNNLLRKMIREGFIRHNNLNWIEHLNDYLYNRNHSRHSTTGYQPAEIWRAGRNKLKRHKDVKVKDARERIKNKARASMERYEAYEYEVGDMVRVLESSLYSSARNLLKAGKKKLIIAKYSPDIYTIAKIIKPTGKDKEFVRTRYFLYDKNNMIVDTELKKNNPNKARAHKLFFASELQKIDKMPKEIISQDTTENWNKMQIDYEEEKAEKEAEVKVHQTRSQTKKDATPKTKVHQTRSRGLTK